MRPLLPLALVLALALPAAAAKPKPVPARAAAPAVVDRSGPAPAWLARPDTYTEGGRTFARATLDEQPDLQAALEDGKYQALRGLAETVVQRVQAEYRTSSQGASNDVDGVGGEAATELTRSQFASVAEAVDLVGAQREGAYWEKRRGRDGEPVYKVIVLVSVPAAQLDAAREAARGALRTVRTAATPPPRPTAEPASPLPPRPTAEPASPPPPRPTAEPAAPLPPRPTAEPAALAPRWVQGRHEIAIPGSQATEAGKAQARDAARRDAIERAMGVGVSGRVHGETTRDGRKTRQVFVNVLSARADGLALDERATTWRFVAALADGGHKYVYEASFLVAPPPPPDPTAHVELRLPHTVYRAGEALTFQVTSHQAATLAVVNLAADDRVYVLYPNAYTPSLAIAANETLTLPGSADEFAIRPEPLPGHARDREAIQVVATRTWRPLPVRDAAGSMSRKAWLEWLYGLPPRSYAAADEGYEVLAPD